jgi:hypothetical protein
LFAASSGAWTISHSRSSAGLVAVTRTLNVARHAIAPRSRSRSRSLAGARSICASEIGATGEMIAATLRSASGHSAPRSAVGNHACSAAAVRGAIDGRPASTEGRSSVHGFIPAGRPARSTTTTSAAAAGKAGVTTSAAGTSAAFTDCESRLLRETQDAHGNQSQLGFFHRETPVTLGR